MNGKHIVSACALVALMPAFAAVRPAMIFNDNMVLQRDCKVPVWGTAEPGEEVKVSFAGQSLTAKADAKGAWMVTLAPMKACAEGRPLTIASQSFSNVAVGEVWLCSGQSNMSMRMWTNPYVGMHGNREINGYLDCMIVDEPEIRGVQVPNVWSVGEKELDKRLEWEAFAPNRQQMFSAIAFHYAMILHEALKVPVGVIVSAWGGTNIETWISPDGYRSVKGLEGFADKTILAKDPNAEQPKTDAQDAKKPTATAKKRKMELHKQPRALWNAMIHPLVPYAFRGAIWYQGESNRGQGYKYKDYLHALHNGWSKAFDNPDMPFYVVQIAPYDYGFKADQPGAAALCEIWKAEADFAHEIPNGGCAVIVDVGDHDNIHPGDKRTVSMRLAAFALNKTYGRKDVPCESPEVKSAKVEQGVAKIAFSNVTKWVMHGNDPAKFEIAGADNVYRLAKVKFVDGGVELSNADVPEPKFARYMWNWCWNGRLKNDYGLPLGPFRIGLP